MRATPRANLLLIQGTDLSGRAAVETVMILTSDFMRGQSVGHFRFSNGGATSRIIA